MKVGVVDYGAGNLLSVRRAFEHLGAAVSIIGGARQVQAADRLVLPGVGAFSKGMDGLRQLDLVVAIRDFAASGKPLLGICLGMQMLLDESEEFGVHEGLGLIGGRVEPLDEIGADGAPLKVPHIGWSDLIAVEGRAWDGTLLSGVRPGAAVYFNHSLVARTRAPEHRLAETRYDGQPIGAVIGRDNVFGCQFHPEKSGPVGLAILRSFLAS